MLLLLLHAVKVPLTHSDAMNEQPTKCPVLNSPSQVLLIETGVFVYEYPRIGGVNEDPAPWGQMVHSLIQHGWRNSTNGSAVHDPLATRQPCSPPASCQDRMVGGSRVAYSYTNIFISTQGSAMENHWGNGTGKPTL